MKAFRNKFLKITSKDENSAWYSKTGYMQYFMFITSGKLTYADHWINFYNEGARSLHLGEPSLNIIYDKRLNIIRKDFNVSYVEGLTVLSWTKSGIIDIMYKNYKPIDNGNYGLIRPTDGMLRDYLTNKEVFNLLLLR